MAGRWKSILVLLLVGVIGAPLRAQEEAPRPFDCGPSSLFVLIRLMNRDATYEAVLQALPPRQPAGYSMMELQAAASRLGLSLSGVRLDRRDARLAAPAIAHLQSGREGHFVVLAPVGTTGRMVQVIDPPSAPMIRDLDELVASPPWTGRLLIDQPWNRRLIVRLGATGAAIALAALALLAWKRRVSSPPPAPA